MSAPWNCSRSRHPRSACLTPQGRRPHVAGPRADAVTTELKSQAGGVAVVAYGRGETNPVAPNTKDGKDYPEGRAKNRRVEITFADD